MALPLRSILAGLSVSRPLTCKCIAPISRAPWLRSSRVFATTEVKSEGDMKPNEEEGHWVTMEEREASRTVEEQAEEDGGGLILRLARWADLTAQSPPGMETGKKVAVATISSL